jgi:hypothetical protein
VSEDEIFVFFVSALLALTGTAQTSTANLHALHFRNNPGIGLVKIAGWLAMTWIALVLWRYADPSVTGIYIGFYLLMGLAVVKTFGPGASALFGVRFRVDVCERKNFSGAMLLAAFILGTGLIFGGSLWGEADPDGDGEGGWWIPLGFFLLGWIALVGLAAIFFWREPGTIREQLLQSRSNLHAQAGAAYLLGIAVILTETVAGDFHGWWHGLGTFGVVGMMLLAHEGFLWFTHSTAGTGDDPVRLPRWLESGFYLFCGFGTWGANRLLDQMLLSS